MKLHKDNQAPVCGFPLFILLGLGLPSAIVLLRLFPAGKAFVTTYCIEIAFASRISTVFRAVMILRLHKSPNTPLFKEFLVSLNLFTGAMATFISSVMTPIGLGPGLASQVVLFGLVTVGNEWMCETIMTKPNSIRHITTLQGYLPATMLLPYLTGTSHLYLEEDGLLQADRHTYMAPSESRGYSCLAVAVQWQVFACFASTALIALWDIVHRRTFLSSATHLLTPSAANRAKKWPFDDYRGFHKLLRLILLLNIGVLIARDMALALLL